MGFIYGRTFPWYLSTAPNNSLICNHGAMAMYGDPDFSWRLCANENQRRMYCPINYGTMTDLPNSGGGGTDFGCTRVMFKRKILIFLIINLSFHHDFFFGIRSAKLKKKNLSVGMWIITSTWKEQKRITNGEQRHFGVAQNRPHLEIGGDFGKKTLKKNWKSYMQGWFWEKKTKNWKFYMQVFQ